MGRVWSRARAGACLWEARVVRERVWKMSSEAEGLGGVSLACWAIVRALALQRDGESGRTFSRVT